MSIPKEYPAEYWVELAQLPHLLGRLTVIKIGQQFNVELDLVLKESRKIFRHLDILYNLPAFDEALDLGYQQMAKKLRATA